ncbi:GDP-L-galactose phosphorylase 1 [Rhynchospora pubera]|uniref:GDP-D-glucose phosphorylase 1 n=1 Tax=Rhynchospora pubera TaxID=906938 RepID=A0AAV8DEN7_9POAL|nr:GDP-L-galactose phosphorylase 1 [Rhynchospora pubera]
MLKIKRVPTVMSNYQEEVTTEAVGCGRNCLGKCCLQVSNLPLYTFSSDQNSPKSESFLSELLLAQWEEKMRQGLFRYDVTACETKVIPGPQGFIAQLNEGRHLKKRPTEFRVDQVLQPFDPAKFNFTKVGQEEVLFQFQNGGTINKSYFLETAGVNPAIAPNIVAINVSPIEYGHVLLIPRVLDCVPQQIDQDGILLALHMAAEASNPYFRLGYNSLGAFATINHLHFQAYYLNIQLPVEKAQMEMITQRGLRPESEKGVKVSRLMNYPVRGLVFSEGNTVGDLADVVSKACICLQQNNIPFNVLISDRGRQIYLFPQCYAEKQALGEISQELLDTQVNPAVWEISGHIVLKRRKDYDEASEASAWRLLAEVSLSEERFEEVKEYIFAAIGVVESKFEVNNEEKQKAEEEAMLDGNMFEPVASHFQEGCLVVE